MPYLAAWGKLMIDNALGAAGTNTAEVGYAAMGQVGILYEGLAILAGGAILGGLVLETIATFVIERDVGLRGRRLSAHLLWLYAQ